MYVAFRLFNVCSVPCVDFGKARRGGKTGQEAEGDGRPTKEPYFPAGSGVGGAGVAHSEGGWPSSLPPDVLESHACRSRIARPPPNTRSVGRGERGGSGRGAASPVLIPSQRKKSDGGRRGNLLTLTNLGFPYKPSKALKAGKCQHLDPMSQGLKKPALNLSIIVKNQ